MGPKASWSIGIELIGNGILELWRLVPMMALGVPEITSIPCQSVVLTEHRVSEVVTSDSDQAPQSTCIVWQTNLNSPLIPGMDSRGQSGNIEILGNIRWAGVALEPFNLILLVVSLQYRMRARVAAERSTAASSRRD